MSRPPRLAIYARYSSDLQNPTSVDDQVAFCKKLIPASFGSDPDKALVYSDAAISGATMERPGLVRLLAALKAGRVDVVVTEGLDRLSRSLKDIAAIYETVGYHDARIWTSHEGWISELHIGLKGTMNALFLRDMKARVKRGHRAKIESGLSASSCAYGYRVVRGVVDDRGRNVNGVREIASTEAGVIQRIYEEFANGKKVKEIVVGLNEDEIPAPGGGLWKPTALVCGARKQMGLLRNEIYRGFLIFNRTHVVRDPLTNKKRYVQNPESEWTKVEVGHLRIIDESLWERVRHLDNPKPFGTRLKQTSKRKTPEILTKHNVHALTGWVKCGWCGGGKQLANLTRYLCSTHRYAGKCKNSRGTKEAVLLAAVFEKIHSRIASGPDFRPLLAKALAHDEVKIERLRKREQVIQVRIGRLLDAVEAGVARENVTERIVSLQHEVAEVRAGIEEERYPAFFSEQTIRAAMAKAVASLELSDDIVQQRHMFKSLLDKVVLTPIESQRSGETILITLREAGWPEFWQNFASKA